MRDAGDGDVLDREHGNDAAANVQKSAEGLQPDDPAGEDGSRLQMFQKEIHGLFLSRPAAQQGDRGAFCVGVDASYCKAGCLSNP